MSPANSSHCMNFTEGEATPDMSELCFTWSAVFRIVFCSLMMLVGVPGNCLVLRVYWIKPRKSSTHVLIIGLAGVDVLACVLLFSELADSCFIQGWDSPAALAIIITFRVLLSSSVVIISLITFDRYDCVCRHNRRLLSPRLAKASMACGLALSTLVQIPEFLFRLHLAQKLMIFVMMVLQMISMTALLILIFVCYGKIYLTIRRHVASCAWYRNNPPKLFNHCPRRNRIHPSPETPAPPDCAPAAPDDDDAQISTVELSNGKTSRDRQGRRAQLPGGGPKSNLQRRTTRMLLVSALAFLLLWTPYWVHFVFRAVHEFHEEKARVHLAVSHDLQVISFSSSAINPLIYGLANRRFRRDCSTVLAELIHCFRTLIP